ncbi:hypothetical protein DUI87_14439 [Hirundo rustica rustica]|uniref:DUF4455 domain-containing protein n=2 Tax=Hirundo rustica TaxID=43150 RepID=A0A3M0K4Q9_HIRRU|nr:hypothetical protein DUI87_14439 [Hirundo rustica rustica]
MHSKYAMPLPWNQQKCVGKTPISDFTRKPQSDRQPTTFPEAWGNVDASSAEKVRGLPDVVVAEEAGSNTWKYLAERRQKRHDRAVTKMQLELDCIGREMEASVLKLQEFLQLKVMKSDEKSKLLFEKIASDTALEGFSFEIADVLTKYTVKLEEISFFLAADVHKLINDKAMNINRALLGNERATAKLLFNLMKSELEKEKSHQLKWQERVKDWKLIQKNCAVQSFREFMASEEVQSPPAVKMENMIKEQIVLSQQRLRVLQHIGYLTLVSYFDSALLPPTHTKSDIDEWYRTLENLNKSIDTHNVECVEKMRVQYELVQGKCLEKVEICKMTLLDMNICTVGDVEAVHSNMLQLTEQLKRRFEEELEQMDSDFKEMAQWHEEHCQGLYSCVQEAMGFWDVHQLQLSQQQDALQKKVDACRWEQDNIIQMMKDNLDTILEKMKMASCEEKLKEYLENTLSSLDRIRTRNETLNQIVMDEVMAYPKAILWELISYSMSISQHFSVKEIFKESVSKSSEAESAEIATEVFPTDSGNTYTVLGVEGAGKTDTNESYFIKYEKEESLPIYLKYVLLTEAMFVKLKERIRLCFSEHLEKWFAESLSNSYVFVAAKKEELNSILLLHLQLHQEKQEEIQANIYNIRAAELSLHKEHLECHCAVLAEGLEKEKAEFLRFSDQLNNLNTDFPSRVRKLEYDLLHAPVTEQLFSEGGDFSSEEVKFFNQCLQKESKQIDSFESSIKTDVENIKSSCLEQATELFKQSEKKFASLSRSRAFMEKVHQSLRKLRQQIKSEAANSNLQSATLKSYLEKLQQKRATYVQSTADKEVTSDQHEMKDFTTPGTDGTLQEDFPTPDEAGRLQGVIAPAVPKQSLRDESKRMVMGLDPDKFPLLNPSRMDTSVFNDLAINVIKNLAGFDPSKKSQDPSQRTNDPEAVLRPVKKKFSDAHSQKSTSKRSSRDETKPKKREKGRKSLTRDERPQIFGKKPANSDTFKTIIMNILWKGSDTLLCLGEEFYGDKKNTQIGMLEDLPDTFERWAEMLRLKLLSYQRHTDDYYNFCLREFRDQLKWFEEELSSVSQLVVESLLKVHEQKLSSSTGHIQHLFNRQLREWEDVKDCAAECAQSFFSALAALTEKLLLELDETITVDDVKVAETEMPTEKTSSVMHCKQAGLPLGTSKVQQLVKRGRRSWPGIPETTLPDTPDYTLCRGTASVSTAKTTLGHLAVVDARQAAYKKYKSKVEQMFAQIKEESTAQLLAIQRWNDWWEESIRKIKRLYL